MKRFKNHFDGLVYNGDWHTRLLDSLGLAEESAISPQIRKAVIELKAQLSTVEKHYAWLRSGDGSNRMAELLADSFSRM